MFRKKIILLIYLAFFLLGNKGCSSSDIYPQRSQKTLYFYNDSSFKNVEKSVCGELRRARKVTAIEFVMVILKKIPKDILIEEYADNLFNKWKIGSRTGGKGVLILFVEDQHALKIEVSYALEHIFTDAYCSLFQPVIKGFYAENYMGDVFCCLVFCLEKKILYGIDYSLEDALSTAGVMIKPINKQAVYLSGGAGISDNKYFYDKDIKLSLIRALPEKRIREFDTYKDIDIVLERYFKTLEEGINYPFLGIFTEGSQMSRLEYPESLFYMQSHLKSYRQAFPYQIVYNETGDLAALRFKGEKAKYVLPIYLRRTPDGFWKLDITKAYAFSAGKEDLEVFSLYEDHPWMFAYSKSKGKKSLCNIPELITFPLNLKERTKKLEEAIQENPKDASNYFKLADILYWECYWIKAAIDVAEKGLELEPDNYPYRWLVINMRYRFPSAELNQKHYDALLHYYPKDVIVLLFSSRYYWYSLMDYKKALKILSKVKKIDENKYAGLYFSNLIDYMINYWKQVSLDRNIIWKITHFIYIFCF